MTNKLKFFISIGLVLFLSGCKLVIFDPKGSIAADEKDIIIISTLLMLIVVIPVIIMTFLFAWRYRASNKKATYMPEWAHSVKIEMVVWTIPLIIITILAIITWKSSHKLDPYKPLNVSGEPITIEVIALDWKWLFIYPDENIAVINYMQIPENRPINFKITADAPMNSFWIPQLGGQIYAMPGMQSKLHLIAHEKGSYDGFSASFSGPGFSGMKFIAKVSSEKDFLNWVHLVGQSQDQLNILEYNKLAKPSENNIPQYYSDVENNLFKTVIAKYMMPVGGINKNMEKM
ncbi:MAG TPA: ubiquinol oxidase subunit II [Burkholderiales bacterium]|nr:ubiquinol oxidase subunit II [Burkholderiales bacterium]